MMVLCAVVTKVVRTRFPEVPKLALCIPALQPVELHVHLLCLVGGDFFIGYSNVIRVFSMDRWLGLRPTHFYRCLVERHHFFSRYVETCYLSFSSGLHYTFYDLGTGENKSIVYGDESVFIQHYVRASLTPRFANI